MAGPWEKFQSKEPKSGPWTKFQKPAEEAPAPSEEPEGIAKKAGRVATGLAVGVAETVNPLAVIRPLEIAGRAFA